jgi:deoxyadenosine/deoxycytidine kinase
MSLIISIDGNIGSGKSTIVHNLKDIFMNEENIIFLEEPINEWIKIKDKNKNILEKFYEDPIKYAFPFQMMALISRFNILSETIKKYPNSIIITERSLYTDKYIFAKMLYESFKMNTFEYQIYNKWFNEFSKQIPDHRYIYISTDPETCNNRIIKRNRLGENNINIDYLESCHNYHNDMFNIIKTDLIIDLNDCELYSDNYNIIINRIRDYIIIQKHINDISNNSLINILILLLVMSFLFLLLIYLNNI